MRTFTKHLLPEHRASHGYRTHVQAKDPVAAMLEEAHPEVDSTGTDGEDGAGNGRAGAGGGETRDIDAVRGSGGRGVFYVASRPAQVSIP